jgi:adenosylcobinamide kinase/adenosylcobinamide-phosphate guanylyltransferase
VEPVKILVTGGVRSGKSAHAESLVSGAAAVTYVAPGPVPDGNDPEWAARISAHRERRPGHWTTIETADLAGVLGGLDKLDHRRELDHGGSTVLVDCLGTWLTAVIDGLDGWETRKAAWEDAFEATLDAAVMAVAEADSIVLVTNEVGLGVVPAHPSGRLFRDLLGTVNQRFAATCDEVHLVIAGRVLKL